MLSPEKQATLLLVDDELPALALRKMVLERSGYLTLTATTSNEAIELFQSHPVDLVVSDHLLAGELGTELATRMKQMKPNVPIVILAGAPPEEGGSGNIDAFMLKGEPVDKLLALFRNLLQR